MKFLHAADIHLDSPMAGLQARDDLPSGLLRHCTRRAFEALVQLAIDEDVAFVVIAGDLYDGDWKDFSTGLFFAEQMRRLGRPCFLLRGNHDAQSVITRALRTLPDTVRSFSHQACESFELPELGVVLHGHSFATRAVMDNLSAAYPAARPGLLNIGVLHSSAEEPGDHEPYAPCRVPELVLKGYDYWALGHIHARRVLHERPWVVFPGNLQGRHARETGPKGCTLVTVEDRQVVAVEHRTLDVVRWAHLTLPAEGLDIIALHAALDTLAAGAVAEAEARPILARLTLTGETALHERLAGEREQLAAELIDAASRAGGALHVESVRLATRPPRRRDGDLAAPLRAAFDAGLDDPAIAAELLDALSALRDKLPPELHAVVDLPRDEAGLRALAEHAWAVAEAMVQDRGA